MTQKQRTVLLWAVVILLLLLQLLLLERQGESGVKYLGRIGLLTVISYNISRSQTHR